ncbi:MAG: hypothetical protein M1831_000576 [Alyxoria varia]|nr:MAG: hypothetical protein M1831_000576 [Alyxoria varia]
MKAALITGALASLAPAVWANPMDKRQDVDYNKVDYPEGTGENLPSYPPGTGENLPFYPNTGCPNPVFNFTSTFSIVATPDQVVNGTTDPVFTGGLPGCTGFFNFGLNSELDLICYAIKLEGFRGEFSSPALTATHIHEAAAGAAGPPRIVFPNPVGDETVRYSFGCVTGPFTTNVTTTGSDSGEGFKVAQIEANPSGFFADTHSSLAVPGAVRGQFP